MAARGPSQDANPIMPWLCFKSFQLLPGLHLSQVLHWRLTMIWPLSVPKLFPWLLVDLLKYVQCLGFHNSVHTASFAWSVLTPPHLFLAFRQTPIHLSKHSSSITSAMKLLLTASCHTVDHWLLLSLICTWQMISIMAKMNSICFLISKSLQSSFNEKSSYITWTSKPKRNYKAWKNE